VAKIKLEAPWMLQFEPAKFLASPDVVQMTNSEVGQYALLLFLQWQTPGCYLPSDPKILATFARTGDQPVSPLVMSKFQVLKNGEGTLGFRNEKLFATWLKAIKKSQVAAKSASCRWDNADANALRTHEQGACERNATQTQTQTKTKTTSEREREGATPDGFGTGTEVSV
jgi:uncharacterized protein YdaU (DUF1376 family)